MTETGIGARVKRKEDHRFITGKGRYTDDINLPGQTHAYFIRSPHAHAEIKKIDAKAALKQPGVLAVLTGDDVAKDNLGGLICGWMIHSKDGSPMKAGPHPLLAQGRARHVGDPVAVVIAETRDIARAAAESVNVSTTRRCRPWCTPPTPRRGVPPRCMTWRPSAIPLSSGSWATRMRPRPPSSRLTT
jgi:carbon-monoxide dehydrogenase large subunit